MFPPNCIVLLAPSNVWQAHAIYKQMALLKDRIEQLRIY